MSKSEILKTKIFDLVTLQKKLHLWRFKEQRIVFTNGCFDILHQGHVHLLSQAADLGDILIVGLNSDESIRNLKGVNRPLQDEQTRASVLASLFYINAVVLFNEETPIQLIKMITPEVLVKGGDYNIETVVGADWVQQHGGKVELIPLLEGYSTTNLEQKMKRT